jgi:DNA-binding transcriptional ArsR family regulator
MPPVSTTPDPRVAAIKALAHPTRLRIAEALAGGPLCVSEIHALTSADLSTVSKHLSLMRAAGWLACERDGQQVRYRLACDCLPTFLRCIDSIRPAHDDCGC